MSQNQYHTESLETDREIEHDYHALVMQLSGPKTLPILTVTLGEIPPIEL